MCIRDRLWVVLVAWQNPLRLVHLASVMDHRVWLLCRCYVLMLYSVHCGRVIMIRLVHVCWHLIRERVPHWHWLLLSRICGTNHILIEGDLRPIVVDLVLLYQLLECLLIDRLVYKVAMTCISVHCPLIYLHCRVARLILFVVLGCPSRVSSRVRAALSHH